MSLNKIVVLALFSASVVAARCDSISAAASGGWKAAKSAPHDGTVVEMMETYGVAPWYGIFKWTKDRDGRSHDGKSFKYASRPSWVQVDNPDHGVDEDDCLFWRPYKATGKYVDPTGGAAQRSIAYWCAAMHVSYDPKKDACK